MNENLENFSGDGQSSLTSEGASYGSELAYGEEEDDQRYRKEMIFAELDFTKHKTKFAATLGPASSGVPQIIKLLDAGMSSVRFNFSHGSKKENKRLLANFKEAKALRPNKTCGTIMDLKGRQIRVGKYTEPAEGVPVDMGDVIFVRSDRHETESSTSDAILVDSHEFMLAVRPGDLVGFQDGTLNAIVIEVDETQVKVQFKDAGLLTSLKSVRIPSARLANMPLLRVQDKEDLLDVAIPRKFDYVSIPCITSLKDIQEAKYSFGTRDEYAQRMGVLARIDNVEALH